MHLLPPLVLQNPLALLPQTFCVNLHLPFRQPVVGIIYKTVDLSIKSLSLPLPLQERTKAGPTSPLTSFLNLLRVCRLWVREHFTSHFITHSRALSLLLVLLLSSLLLRAPPCPLASSRPRRSSSPPSPKITSGYLRKPTSRHESGMEKRKERKEKKNWKAEARVNILAIHPPLFPNRVMTYSLRTLRYFYFREISNGASCYIISAGEHLLHVVQLDYEWLFIEHLWRWQ